MPRPTVAQLAYGSATVICSTLAMLLLSQTSSAPGVAVITFAALGLGLLVAMTVPLPKPAPEPAGPPPAAAVPAPAPALTTSNFEERIPVQRTVLTPDSATGQHTAPHAPLPVREPAGP
ncbi:hypothetical protein [Streptomyces flavofungini]|uniref:hypothetical protein n=1 Tax=Streptomyces flavofungini TaxID=68200 RepID=UPI0025B156B8|nr:hypothetical protein [Streptomyces flavofungini]WJV48445.1 hypothetical protein QUY26_24745 [Streptomyces flavofungini]